MKIASLLLPIFRKHGRLEQVKFKNVACFTIIHRMALLPSRLSDAVENDAMAAM